MVNPNVFPRFLKAGTEPITVYPRFLVDSFIPIEVDITVPIHISQLTAGDTIRIVLTTKIRYSPVIGRNGKFLIPSKGRMLRGGDRTVLLGRVQSNSPSTGNLTLQVIEDIYGDIFMATIQYAHIDIIQRVIPITTIVETAPQSRPGGRALGTKLIGGQLSQPRNKLIPIKF